MPSRFLALTLLAASSVVHGYFSSDPLVDKVVPYNAIPYHVMTDTDDPRGVQSGYNICNSSTENQDSLCQTMFVNHLDDFCLWAPPQPNTTIAVSEGDEVAWCSKKGHGTRLIPEGAITGVQLIQTPSYIQIAGTINQSWINIGGTDGGELDSGGQDGEGNPMGGLVYTNAFPSAAGNNATYIQAQHWSFFIGDNSFCGKICDQTGSNPQGLCNNVYDRLGCQYNAPNDAVAGVFEACKGDDMIPVGTYVGTDGKTSTYHQPAESVSIDYSALPYTPSPAPSSLCSTFVSASLFTDLAGVTVAPGNGVTSTASSPQNTGGTGTGTGTATKSTTSQTGTNTGSALAKRVSLVAVLAGLVLGLFMF